MKNAGLHIPIVQDDVLIRLESVHVPPARIQRRTDKSVTKVESTKTDKLPANTNKNKVKVK